MLRFSKSLSAVVCAAGLMLWTVGCAKEGGAPAGGDAPAAADHSHDGEGHDHADDAGKAEAPATPAPEGDAATPAPAPEASNADSPAGGSTIKFGDL